MRLLILSILSYLWLNVAVGQTLTNVHQPTASSQQPAAEEFLLLITTPELEAGGHTSAAYREVKRTLATQFANLLVTYLPDSKSFLLRTNETSNSEKLNAMKAKVLEVLPKGKINQMTFQQMQQLKN
jgi:hypothetical protein